MNKSTLERLITTYKSHMTCDNLSNIFGWMGIINAADGQQVQALLAQLERPMDTEDVKCVHFGLLLQLLVG